MYCPNCGKELPGDAKFCPQCGKQTGPTPAPTVKPSALPAAINPKLLIIGAVVVVLLLAFLIFRPGQNEQAQGQDTQISVDPAAALVGTWPTKDGVGLRFTKDGEFKVTAGKHRRDAPQLLRAANRANT